MVSPSTIILSGPRTEMFSYDQVGSPDTTQDQMFEWVGVPIVNKCIQGYNGTIFAYGQTGSGKTLVKFIYKTMDFFFGYSLTKSAFRPIGIPCKADLQLVLQMLDTKV